MWRDQFDGIWAIRATPALDWLLLTKRPERIAANLPKDWGDGYPNVWLGASVENNDYAHRADHLRKVPAVRTRVFLQAIRRAAH